MAVGKELFKLFGLIGMQGVEVVEKDLKKIDRQARKTQKEITRMGKKVQDVGKTLTKAFTVPILAAGVATVKFIEKGADLNETISKTNELFGESSDEIRKWAATAATSIGQSKQQAMDAASTFAIFGKSAGLAGKDLVEFSKQNTELASDLASFFNTKPEDAIQAIGAAYRGETEPIRRYGVMLDDATMRQKALELGLVTTTKKALMPQTKVLAAQALIFEKTKSAQGDFARTSDQLANKQRILSARFENVAASLGSLFLPLALKAVNLVGLMADKIEGLIEWWGELDDSTKKTIAGFVILAAAIGPVTILVGKIIALSNILVPLLVALKTGTLSYAGAVGKLKGSIAGVVIVIGALVAVGWYYYSQWDTISTQLIGIWEKIKLAAFKSGKFIIDIYIKVIDKILEMVGGLSDWIPGLGKKINTARANLLKFQAAMDNVIVTQTQNAVAANDQAKATDGFTDSLKKAIKSGKEALGLTEEQTQADLQAAEAARKKAEERIAFDKEIRDQINQMTKDELALLEIEKQEKIRQAEEIGANTLKIEQLYTLKKREILEKEREERQKFEKASLDELNKLKLDELELLEIEKQEKLIQAEELGAETFAIEETYALKKIELENKISEEKQKLLDKESEEQRRVAQERLNMTMSISNRINSILSKYSSNQISRIDNEEQRKIESIKNSKRTEEQKEAAIQRVNEQSEKKRKVIEKQRAAREKAMALFSIAINTARAIVEALPNIPLSIAVGALGAAEASVVMTEPEPFFEGGMIKGSQGGVNAIVGEKNQDELIFPLERGINAISDGLIERLANFKFPELPSIGGQELAGAGGNNVSLHIGTFIGDDNSLKKLERKLENIRINETRRRGF